MLSYKVFRENLNSRKIEEYDIFKGGHWEEVARKLKQECIDRAEWEKCFRVKLMSMYWCRSEYEIILTSWPPYITAEEVDRLQEELKDREKTWGSRAVKVNVNLSTEEKIDIFRQIDMNWRVFANYVWENV